MNSLRYLLVAFTIITFSGVADARDFPLFRARDPLTPRDSWGELHRSPVVEEIDLLPRESWRLFYYSKSGNALRTEAAYIGALQTALQRNGYYCGPLDGTFSVEVSDAIARLQKNYSMRVTGTITVPVRRALYLP